MEVKCCPGCAHTGFQIKGQKGKLFDTLVGEVLFRQQDYYIKCCLQCGLYYKSHILSASELAHYYQVVDFSKWESDELFPSEQALIVTLRKLPKGSRVLDYGCSSGRLLSHLVNDYMCFGVEVNEKAASSAVSKGIKILSEKDVLVSSPFDAIVLCDVFEHLPDPISVLRMLCRKLNQHGLLILCTGNADARACQKDIANFWYFRTPEHLCMLSRKFISFLASNLKLDLLVWKEISHYDVRLLERVRQHLKNFAYWQFHGEGISALVPILRFLPFIKRARNWDVQPALTCTDDHVLAVFINNVPRCVSDK
jgi:SAM-dependent methyltransferase